MTPIHQSPISYQLAGSCVAKIAEPLMELLISGSLEDLSCQPTPHGFSIKSATAKNEEDLKERIKMIFKERLNIEKTQEPHLSFILNEQIIDLDPKKALLNQQPVQFKISASVTFKHNMSTINELSANIFVYLPSITPRVESSIGFACSEGNQKVRLFVKLQAVRSMITTIYDHALDLYLPQLAENLTSKN